MTDIIKLETLELQLAKDFIKSVAKNKIRNLTIKY
jgi:hypothetical protein